MALRLMVIPRLTREQVGKDADEVERLLRFAEKNMLTQFGPRSQTLKLHRLAWHAGNAMRLHGKMAL